MTLQKILLAALFAGLTIAWCGTPPPTQEQIRTSELRYKMADLEEGMNFLFDPPLTSKFETVPSTRCGAPAPAQEQLRNMQIVAEIAKHAAELDKFNKIVVDTFFHMVTMSQSPDNFVSKIHTLRLTMTLTTSRPAVSRLN